MPPGRRNMPIWRALHALTTAGELHRTHHAWPPSVSFSEMEGLRVGYRRFRGSDAWETLTSKQTTNPGVPRPVVQFAH